MLSFRFAKKRDDDDYEAREANCELLYAKSKETRERRLERGGGGFRRNGLYGQMNCKKKAHHQSDMNKRAGDGPAEVYVE